MTTFSDIFLLPDPTAPSSLLLGMVVTSTPQELEVPTEALLRPEQPVPRLQTARVYPLPYYLLPTGEAATTKGLIAWCEKEGKPFRGTADFDALVLVEVIDDEGSDGHVDYRVVGHRIMRDEDVRTWKDLVVRGDEYDALVNFWRNRKKTHARVDEGCQIVNTLLEGNEP